MTARGICGRADLLRALATGDTALVAAMADLLELELPSEEKGPQTGADKSPQGPGTSEPEPEQPDRMSERALAPVPFWRLATYERLSSDTPEEPALIGEAVEWSDKPSAAKYQPLSSWQHLQPRLRGAIAAQQPGGAIDWDKLVRWIGRGRLIEVMPRRRRRGWGSRVQIVEDRSTRLTPYWRDQAMVCTELARLFPDYAIEYHRLRESSSLREPSRDRTGMHRPRIPPEGSLVLVMSDLGALAKDGGRAVRFWQRMGKAWEDAGCHLLALVPTDTENIPATLRQRFQPLAWEHRRRSNMPGDSLERQAEALICRVSPALRIEPGWLRDVRRAMHYDSGTESLVWQHAAVISSHSEAASLDPKHANRLRKAFVNVPLVERQTVLRSLRQWHASLGREIWFEEILSLLPETRDALPVPSEYHLACRFFLRFSEQGRGKVPDRLSSAQSAWFTRTARRLPDASWGDPNVGPSLQRLADHLRRTNPDVATEAYVDPGVIAPEGNPVGSVTVNLEGKRLCFRRPDAQVHDTGSPLGILHSHNGLFRIETRVEPGDGLSISGTAELVDLRDRQQADVPLPVESSRLQIHGDSTEISVFRDTRPDWAVAMGRDRFGLWAEFDVSDRADTALIQRLRWIPAGEFQMGSPEDEPERGGDELLHSVTLTQGYWLADTACTQALWEAVTGSNPSDFKGSNRPVENVTWEEVQQLFIEQLNTRLPGLNSRLPTEAEWEYAARAGSQTPFWWGSTLSPEQANYKREIPYADGETGKFLGESVSVKEFEPNPWGLYQVHGNVYEWCEDWMGEYEAGPVEDPQGSESGGRRVCRGGGWGGKGRRLRVACRLLNEPGNRDGSLGFRLCAGQSRAELR